MPLIPSFCEGAPTASQLILRGSCKLSATAVLMKMASVRLRGQHFATGSHLSYTASDSQ